ncbi:MAG: type II toxin-antitoxin system PemK/MazF family toxin [Candidatus Woesearchaeota archaeon]|nr:MAG: type II toxin-antitoxin system PemK/MazF family toxin [Candidatus Woesearchaeota archaeon]
MSGTNLHKQGEIVFMTCPFVDKTGRLSSKSRPVLIISNEEYNKKNNSLLVCALTTTIRKWPKSIFLDSKLCMENGTLPLNSELRPDLVFNGHKTEIGRKCGEIKESVLQEAIQNLKDIIAIDSPLTKFI